MARNVQATTDSDGHAEPALAVDQKNPKDLLGAAQYLAAGGARLPGTFYSTDAGQTWHDNGPLPLPSGYSQGVDTTTAFSPNGVGYVCAFALARGASSFASRSSASAVLIWKTTDGGRTFQAPVSVYRGPGFQDHPWLTSGGGQTLDVSWANRAGLVFSRSTDGGGSFSAPRVLVAGSKPANPVVVAAGRRVDIFYEEAHGSTLTVGLVRLNRRGLPISLPQVIASGPGGPPAATGKKHAFFPLFAAAGSPDGAELAVAMPTVDVSAGHPTIELWRSPDAGRLWHGPTTIVRGQAATETQLQPNLAVLGNDLLASFFTESRAGAYSEWVSQLTPTGDVGPSRLVSTARFHASGWLGDYQALAVSGNTAHLGWNDGRTGRLQIFTASISGRRG